MDFAKRLKEQRLKEKMEQAIPKHDKVNLNPTPRKKKAEEEAPPPDIRELDIEPADRLQMVRLAIQHAAQGMAEKHAQQAKKVLTDRLRVFVNKYGLTKFQIDGNRCNNYTQIRSSISKELLLAHNVSPETIAACTTTKEILTFRLTPPAGTEVEEDDDE